MDLSKKRKNRKGNNQLNLSERAKIIKLIAEGNTLKGTARITEHAYNTVLGLSKIVGKACYDFQQNIPRMNCPLIECDELASFVYCKSQNLPPHLKRRQFLGTIYAYVAIDVQSRYIVFALYGKRNAANTRRFIKGLSEKVSGRIQLTTDGMQAYEDAVDRQFGKEIDYCQIKKIYKNKFLKTEKGEKIINPDTLVKSHKYIMSGKPAMEKVSTNYVERFNLTLRQYSSRVGRDKTSYSKKFDSHCYGLALTIMWYNYCKIHHSLRVTPAMQLGLTDDIWTAEDLVRLAFPEA